jgi:hypothetical protein
MKGVWSLMTKIWKINAFTKRMGGGGPPLEEYFLMAITDKQAALAALRRRRPDLEGSDFTVVGEASPDVVEWLDVKDDRIRCVTEAS